MNDMKQVFVIRKDLGMSPGKVAAQVAHACLEAYSDTMDRWGAISGDMVESWDEAQRPKICLTVDSEAALHKLESMCVEANIGHYLVHDAGRTEIAPGTPTVLGIGPDFNRYIDRLTGDLETY